MNQLSCMQGQCPTTALALIAANLILSEIRSTHGDNSISDPRSLVCQDCQAQAIVIAGVRVSDFGLRFLKLCLT